MMPEWCWNFLLLACVAAFVRAEVFTSLAHLEATLYAERDIASTLKNYVTKERERLDKLEKLADDYEQHSRKALEDPYFYLANPVNAFLLIKRFTLDWDRNVSPVVSNHSWDEFNQELQFARQDLPTFEDLTGAATALMRLQDTYHLDTSKIAHGNLGGVDSSTLTVDECFELGRLTYNEDDYYHTTLWMEQALSLLGDDPSTETERASMLDYLAFSYYKDCFLLGRLSYNEKDLYHTTLWMQEALALDTVSPADGKTIPRKEILDYLSYTLALQGHVKHALALTNELLALDPTHERAFNNKRYFEEMLVKQGETMEQGDTAEPPAVERQIDDYRKSKEFQTYEALCRGESPQRVRDEHKLTCQYVHNNNPWLMLQPVKEEIMHIDPWLVIYHDVLSDSEINDIKFLATPKLNRATVQNSQTGELETATYRISKSAWLKGTDHPTVAKVNERIEAITGLELDTAEELQIANYGLGGHYEPHFDFARDRKLTALEKSIGNRIATFLIYMSDVEAGGATVFPYLGLKLFPKKGAAAFWYNLYRTGDGIYNTRHAACPVLVGVKWVANKWIHERGQEFRRPCSLSPDE